MADAVIDLCSDTVSDSEQESDSFPSSPLSNFVYAPKAQSTSEKRREQTQQTRPNQSQQRKHEPTLPKETGPTPSPSPARQPPATLPSTATDTILSSLNAAQRRAVTSTAETVAILAGPGSGKTHTLTARVAWLINFCSYRPQNVVVATFTVKAAREMKARIGKVLGDDRARRIVLGTFHSVARRYLATYGRRIGVQPGFGIVDDADSKAIIARIIKRLGLADLDPPATRAWISKKKAKGSRDVEEAPRPAAARPPTDHIQKMERVLAAYQAHLEGLNLLDYDDLLVRCAALLRQHPGCVCNVQAVLIDEYQDTNGIQFELMQLLAQARRRITVVGDPDQSIYGWRSAERANLVRFLHDYPATDEIALEENYRSSSAILATSLQVIQQDTTRYPKSLLPVHKKGARPVLRHLRSATVEAFWIVSEIQRAKSMCGALLDDGDFAILVRTASLSRPIESALNAQGIPYRMMGGRKFFDRAEVKILVDYLRVIHQPDNNAAMERIVNVPRRGIGVQRLKTLVEVAEEEKISLWSLLTMHFAGRSFPKVDLHNSTKKLRCGLMDMIQAIRQRIADGDAVAKEPPTLVEVIETLIEKLEFREYIKKTYEPEDAGRWANVEELLNLARDFMLQFPARQQEEELPEIPGEAQAKETSVLGQFLSTVSLESDADKQADADGVEKPMVTISTIHAAKGLEWPVVFIPSVIMGVLPHSRSEDSDEERRLLYVAMTRAQCLLNMSYPLYGRAEADQSAEQELSCFLAQLSSPCFLEQGPSYDRGLLEEMGEILGRAVPSEKDIYQRLPPGTRLEDDQIPVQPDEPRQSNWGSQDWGHEDQYDEYNEYDRGDSSRAKRRRMAVPDYSMGSTADGRTWTRHVTTMDNQTSLPGFTTASAHHSAMMAAEAVAEAAAKLAAKEMEKEKRPAAAPSGQPTIMQCFFGKGANAEPKTEPKTEPASTSWQPPRAAARGTPPEWTNRRLGGVMPKLKTGHPSAIKTEADRPAPTNKRYAHFSSSPPRDSPRSKALPAVRTGTESSVPSRPQASQFHGHYVRPEQMQAANWSGGGSSIQTVSANAANRMRPAATFHTTTCAASGVRRIGQNAYASALLKPFKPPSSKR